MSPAALTHASNFLSTHLKEAVKMYIEYDATNRMVTTYTAGADADHGDHCIRTDYTYWGASLRIQKMRESLAAWDSSWDI